METNCLYMTKQEMFVMIQDLVNTSDLSDYDKNRLLEYIGKELEVKRTELDLDITAN